VDAAPDWKLHPPFFAHGIFLGRRDGSYALWWKKNVELSSKLLSNQGVSRLDAVSSHLLWLKHPPNGQGQSILRLSFVPRAFLCYNYHDRVHVEELGEIFNKNDLIPWMDSGPDGLHPRQKLTEQIEVVVDSVPAAVIIIGEHGWGATQRLEAERFYRRQNDAQASSISLFVLKMPGLSDEKFEQLLGRLCPENPHNLMEFKPDVIADTDTEIGKLVQELKKHSKF
jgi:hypothetical protein